MLFLELNLYSVRLYLCLVRVNLDLVKDYLHFLRYTCWEFTYPLKAYLYEVSDISSVFTMGDGVLLWFVLRINVVEYLLILSSKLQKGPQMPCQFSQASCPLLHSSLLAQQESAGHKILPFHCHHSLTLRHMQADGDEPARDWATSMSLWTRNPTPGQLLGIIRTDKVRVPCAAY